MTVKWFEGFDMYNGTGANTGLLSRWNSLSTASFGGGSSASMVAGRFGGQALRLAINGIGNAATIFARAIVEPTGTPTSGCIGFAFRVDTLANGISRCFEVLNSSLASQFGIGINGSGAIYVYTGGGGATLATSTSSGLILVNTWNYIEAAYTLNASTGSVVVNLNGSAVTGLTAVTGNTLGAGSGGGNGIMPVASTSSSFNADFDDIYYNDTNAMLGECKVETLRGTSDAIAETWTPSSGSANYSRVNETLVDGDTSYVSTATVNNKDLYGIGPLGSTPATIFGVSIVSFAEKTDSTTRTMANSIRSGATDSDGTAISLAASYQRYDRLLLTDPNTSAAWNASGVNNLLVGPKLIS